MLSRLDGWLGAACLAALTCLMLGEVVVRALSDISPGCRPISRRLGIQLLSDGGGLHLRRRHDLAGRRPHPRDPGAGACVAGDRRWLETVLAALGMCFSGFLAGPWSTSPGAASPPARFRCRARRRSGSPRRS